MPSISISSRADLPLALNALGLRGKGAEIGVYEGDFAADILALWKGQLLFLVDPWDGSADYLDSWNRGPEGMEGLYQSTLSRMRQYQDRVQIIRSTSRTAASMFEGGELDFVYIDANHGYSYVSDDLMLWFRTIRVGGVMAGHDYFNALADDNLDPVPFSSDAPLPDPNLLSSYGVKAAVDSFAERIGAELQITNERLPTWYFIKTEVQLMRFAAITERDPNGIHGRQSMPGGRP